MGHYGEKGGLEVKSAVTPRQHRQQYWERTLSMKILPVLMFRMHSKEQSLSRVVESLE